MSPPMRGRGLKHSPQTCQDIQDPVAPHAGAWIETENLRMVTGSPTVAPHAGAWIETGYPNPSPCNDGVAPHAGAWIETLLSVHQEYFVGVAPHAGAWIETVLWTASLRWDRSPPMRGRGLKLGCRKALLSLD